METERLEDAQCSKIRIARIVYIDVRGVSGNDYSRYINGFAGVIENNELHDEPGCHLQTLYVPVLNETKIEHAVLDFERMTVIKSTVDTAELNELLVEHLKNFRNSC